MKYFYTITILLFALHTWAQKNYEPEIISWNGTTYAYRYHHMEQYFRYYPAKRPVVSKDSTIINRNYIAAFEVKDNKFYLNNILISGNNKTKNVSAMSHIHDKSEPLYLSWVTGLFDIGMGEEKYSVNDTLTPIYDNYIVFEVARGTIGRVENLTYNQLKLFKDYQHKRFKHTEEYTKLKRSLTQNGMTESEASSHIYNFILFYSKTNFLKKT